MKRIIHKCAGAGGLLCLLGMIAIVKSIDLDRISFESGIVLCGAFLVGLIASVVVCYFTNDD